MLFQIIAVIIMIAFYGCYFAKMLRQRRQNIKTDQLGKGKSGFVKDIEIILKIAAFVLPIAEAMSIFSDIYMAWIWLRIVGAVLGTVGVIVFCISVLAMKDNWRAGVPSEKETELVTNGIYKFSRNPAFLGFDLVYIGILCMFLNVPLLILTAFTVLMLHLQIVNVEEPFMVDSFGEEYLRYRKKVCRYIGRK